MQLTSPKLDALKEIGSMGAGHAATSLSNMLQKRVAVHVPCAQLAGIEEAIESLGGKEALVAVVYLRVLGTVSGSILIIFPLKQALLLADLMLGRKSGGTKFLDEIAQSALKELGNITSGAYLVALSEALEVTLLNSVPGFATDLLQAVLDGVLVESSFKAEQVLMLQTEFGIEHESVCGHFLFVPDPEGLKVLLKEIGV